MRKLVFGINISVDGYCDHTLFMPCDEALNYFTELMRESDVLLYGRKTYELMFPYWPDVVASRSADSVPESGFADAFVAIPEVVVFSKTLQEPVSKNTRIVSRDVREEVQKLKQQPGKNISTGGVSFTSELLQLGLIDEVHLVIHPAIVAGKGRRLFDGADLKEKFEMKLAASRAFKSGTVALHYVKK